MLVDSVPDPVHHGELTLALVVKDETGAVIPNASVSVTQEETGAKFDGKTNQVGTYQASDLAKGSYAVIVKALGFKTFKASTALAAQVAIEMTVTLKVSPTDVDPPMYVLPAPVREAKPFTPEYQFLPTH